MEDRRSRSEFAILNLLSSILDPSDVMLVVVNKQAQRALLSINKVDRPYHKIRAGY